MFVLCRNEKELTDYANDNYAAQCAKDPNNTTPQCKQASKFKFDKKDAYSICLKRYEVFAISAIGIALAGIAIRAVVK